eukprot:TRINITY_DN4423_c0_g2_i1.p1 TRINITY_DN4423_c0_g2~~TRINITY_DN4423_c0_g2_i1.p1  ORF type:complete len:367 (+),score=49.36 TRINITY_DN4423_c0_g2_i1:474-1574(+)
MSSWSVSALDLSGNQFEGKLDTSNFSTSIDDLNLSNNKFSGTIPQNFLVKREKVDLSGNQFSGAIPAFSILSGSMRSLSLANNKLESINSKAFTFLWGLKTLDLSNNMISGDLPENILPSVKIDLSGNQLTSLPKFSFSLVEDLSLVNNLLDHSAFSSKTFLFAKSDLENLDLSNNRLTHIPTEILNMPVLKKILKENELDGPNLTKTSEGCLLTISVREKTPESSGSSSIMGVIGGVIGAVFLLLAISLLVFWKFYYQQKFSLSYLPSDVRWFYEQYYKHPGSWKKEGKLWNRECNRTPKFSRKKHAFLKSKEIFALGRLINSKREQMNVVGTNPTPLLYFQLFTGPISILLGKFVPPDLPICPV